MSDLLQKPSFYSSVSRFTELFQPPKLHIVSIYISNELQLHANRRLTSRAAESFPLLPPFGVAQDVDDERGELPGVEASQLLAALRAQTSHESEAGLAGANALEAVPPRGMQNPAHWLVRCPRGCCGQRPRAVEKRSHTSPVARTHTRAITSALTRTQTLGEESVRVYEGTKRKSF